MAILHDELQQWLKMKQEDNAYRAGAIRGLEIAIGRMRRELMEKANSTPA